MEGYWLENCQDVDAGWDGYIEDSLLGAVFGGMQPIVETRTLAPYSYFNAILVH